MNILTVLMVALVIVLSLDPAAERSDQDQLTRQQQAAAKALILQNKRADGSFDTVLQEAADNLRKRHIN